MSTTPVDGGRRTQRGTGTGEQPRPAAAELHATRGALVARLLLPRAREVVLKLPLVPLGALTALVAREHLPGPAELGQLLVLWVLVELLAYQARYQLNDLRDRAADAAHPESAHRGRLSFPWTPLRAAAVWGSVVVRVVLSVLLAVALPGAPGEAALAFLVLLVLVSGGYELVRERIRRAPAVDPTGPRARSLGVPVLLFVPLGYGLRVWTGYHAAAAGELPARLGVLLVVTLLATYTASVLTAWVLEATTFLGERGAPPAAGLGRRAHVALLLHHAGLLRVEGRSERARPADELVVARERPARSALDLKAWDAAGAAALLAAYAAVGVGGGADGTGWAVLAVAGVVSAAAPPVLHLRSRAGVGGWDGRPPWLAPRSLAAVVAVEVTALVVAAVVLLLHDAPQARLLWLVAFVLFQVGSTRTSSYRRGFGPLSLVRRPLAWARDRRR
ncbi:hypothetical protein WDZ17_06840 [Pseudokineococcus basanitobsidens]|uniref:4-hydroxybenzoate polyprenyltransferase n=1 Tax=Pseudokineococcus basanitobsidens TaxID=1926649 RepID=A0ABU8RIV5_9ACTN